MNQQELVQEWRKVTGAEKIFEVQVYQEHLFDLCQLVGHPTPAQLDPGRTLDKFRAKQNRMTGTAHIPRSYAC